MDDKRDLLAIDDLSPEELEKIIHWAISAKQDDGLFEEFMPLTGLTIGSIYEKPSTRTRVSFEVGIDKLGGNPLTLLKGDIQLGKSESIEDTAAVLSRYLGAITYRCFGHSDVEKLANGSTVPVINALSDKHHPCQAAADMMTIAEHFDELSGIKVAWVGDGNNVLHDLMLGATALGMEVHYAIPEGFEPDEKIVFRAKEIAKVTGGAVKMTHDPVEAVKDANVVYTDVFVSMGEEDMKDKMDAFDGFQVNEELVSNADSEYIFMHCLPAHRGEEVTDGVIDSKNSVVFDQAENRMWAQMSLLTFLIHPAAWEAFSELH
ncbi:MAG: ornithine carbamoyltransferase [Candidatus Thermoplasmatota archaeon]|nr:ornithine carbamoyltransferase [Candidatus Thermoplasmatota archaeon]MEC7436651.1 ornithine carbamoyltransferase [Candidatus Thermoplasmatota archaeon]MEC7601394.1 ornithine carbamoyltransferase [Candidatus Thermoplasmatota archaeon]MEC8384620.1 ornithine carbamoyltransferase [Candidatus Thermoplasmatota archaeon]